MSSLCSVNIEITDKRRMFWLSNKPLISSRSVTENMERGGYQVETGIKRRKVMKSGEKMENLQKNVMLLVKTKCFRTYRARLSDPPPSDLKIPPEKPWLRPYWLIYCWPDNSGSYHPQIIGWPSFYFVNFFKLL